MQIDTTTLKGHVVVIMAPTGSGKSTLVRHITAKFPNIYVTISCTTRAPRPGEVDGRDYHFITQEEFRQKETAGEFLEWAEYGGHFYGTLKAEILPRLHEPQIVLAVIELQGMLQLKDILPKQHLTVIYIDAGDWEVLRERVLARAPISETELDARYRRYLIERAAKDHADHIINNTVMNKEMAPAKKQFEDIMQSIYSAIHQ